MAKCYNEINAFIEETVNGKVNTTSNSDVYTDCGLDMNGIECDFKPYKGDRVKLYILKSDPPKVYKIEPWEEVRSYTGKITSLTRSYGTVDDDIIFFTDEDTPLTWDAQIGNDVECVLIDGEYVIGQSKYEIRCESINKVENEEEKRDVEMWFNDSMEANGTGGGGGGTEPANVDSDTEDDQKVAFDHLKRREPNQEYYDLPSDLFTVLMSKKSNQIMRKLDEFVPSQLSYNTYKKRFHALIYLEEVEMRASFDKYKSRNVWIEPENLGKNKRFSIKCTKIAELRPPIAVGMYFKNFIAKEEFYREFDKYKSYI